MEFKPEEIRIWPRAYIRDLDPRHAKKQLTKIKGWSWNLSVPTGGIMHGISFRPCKKVAT